MCLDRVYDCSKFVRDLLVKFAGNDMCQNLAFAWRKLCKPCLDQVQFLVRFPCSGIPLDRAGDCIKQLLVTNGLCQKINGTGFHGPDTCRNISYAGDENHRSFDVSLGEGRLKLETVKIWHGDIEYGAPRD